MAEVLSPGEIGKLRGLLNDRTQPDPDVRHLKWAIDCRADIQHINQSMSRFTFMLRI